MSDLHSIFIQAIHSKNHLNLTFDSNEKGIISRKCIPFDFGPSRRFKDGYDRYHLFDLDGPEGSHTLSILPIQIVDIILLEDLFDPAHYITWTPKWFTARDWGMFS